MVEQVDDHVSESVSDALFTRTATDNAEVVSPTSGRQTDGLWTVSANPSTDDGTAGDDDASVSAQDPDPDAWRRIPPRYEPAPRYEPVSSASSDDEAYLEDQTIRVEPTGTGFPGSPGADKATYDVPEPNDPVADEPTDRSTTDRSTTDQSRTDQSAGEQPPGEQFFDGELWDENDPDGGPEAEGGANGWSGVRDSVGSVFRSEPVVHSDEVIDADDGALEDDPPIVQPGRTLFSSTVNGPRPFNDWQQPESTGAQFSAGRRHDSFDGGDLWQPSSGHSFEHPAGASGSEWNDRSHGPSWASRSEGDIPRPETSTPRQDTSGHSQDPGDRGFDGNSPGFVTSINRLHPQDREKAGEALLVVGALLGENEPVLGVVTGQMLGRPTAVVLTASRVLIGNDRRWQPVVDIYQISDALQVRGRHDRDIAALGFSDETGLSMVDGIEDVSLAMDLVDQLRRLAGDD